MNPVFRRWLYFVGSAVVSGGLLLWLIKEDSFLSGLLGALGAGFCFAFALVHIRPFHPEIKAFRYIVLIALSASISSIYGILWLPPAPWTYFGIMTIGSLMAVITGYTYTRLIKRRSPSMKALSFFGGAGLVFPVVIIFSLEFMGVNVPLQVGAALLSTGWQLMVGFAFSRPAFDESSYDGKYMDLIKKIGSKD